MKMYKPSCSEYEKNIKRYSSRFLMGLILWVMYASLSCLKTPTPQRMAIIRDTTQSVNDVANNPDATKKAQEIAYNKYAEYSKEKAEIGAWRIVATTEGIEKDDAISQPPDADSVNDSTSSSKSDAKSAYIDALKVAVTFLNTSSDSSTEKTLIIVGDLLNYDPKSNLSPEQKWNPVTQSPPISENDREKIYVGIQRIILIRPDTTKINYSEIEARWRTYLVDRGAKDSAISFETFALH